MLLRVLSRRVERENKHAGSWRQTASSLGFYANMGKFRGHKDKSRRGTEKKILKKKGGVAAGGIHAAAQAESTLPGGDSLSSGSPGRQQQQQQREEVGPKRKLKHVTYAKEHSVLLVGDGCFSFKRGVNPTPGNGRWSRRDVPGLPQRFIYSKSTRKSRLGSPSLRPTEPR
ncbi:unnamed protein product [Ectocarpus sp. 8 AP-2014]